MADENGAPIKVGMEIDVKDTEQSVKKVTKTLASEWERVAEKAREAMNATDSKELEGLVSQAQKYVDELNESEEHLRAEKQLQEETLKLKEEEYKLAIQEKTVLSAKNALIKAEAQGKDTTKKAQEYENTQAAVARTKEEIEATKAQMDVLRTTIAETANEAQRLSLEDARVQASGVLDVFEQIEQTSNNLLAEITNISTAETDSETPVFDMAKQGVDEVTSKLADMRAELEESKESLY